jgi:hypothetical protein
VVRGSVRPGFARPQDPGQRFPTGDVGAVEVGQQRVEPEGFLPRFRRVLLLAVRDGDRRVDVDHQPTSHIWARSGGPGTFPRCRAHRLQAGEVFGIDPVENPPRGGVTGHRAE